MIYKMTNSNKLPLTEAPTPTPPNIFYAPDYNNKVDITTDSFTAPENGFLNFQSTINKTYGASATVKIDNITAYTFVNNLEGLNNYNLQQTHLIPIAKGQVATFTTTGGSSWGYRRMFKLKSSVQERSNDV